MRGRRMRRLMHFVCAIAIVVFARGSAAGQSTAASEPGKKASATAPEAQKFIEDAEQRLFDLGVKASRAGWVQENFITDDTEQIAAEAGEAANTAATKYAKEAHRFDGLQLSPELARKRLLLELAAGFPAPDDPKAQKELAQILASLDGEYGKGKWCPDGEKEKCLDVTAVEKLMAESRDPEELKRAWTGWHAIGAPMRQRYVRMVELGNEGARQLGYADVGALWRSNYDMPPDAFAKEEDRLWEQLRPLYLSLHAYVRGQLRKKYGNALVPESVRAPAPAHSHIFFAVGRAHMREATNTAALVAPTAGPLPWQTHPAACRNSSATAPPHPHIPTAAPPHFPVPPSARSADASARQSRAIRSTYASSLPDRGSLPSVFRLPSRPGTFPFLRLDTTCLFHIPRPATPGSAPALSVPSDHPAPEILPPIPIAAVFAPAPATIAVRQNGALLLRTSWPPCSLPRPPPRRSAPCRL